jgi:hypothetical protein
MCCAREPILTTLFKQHQRRTRQEDDTQISIDVKVGKGNLECGFFDNRRRSWDLLNVKSTLDGFGGLQATNWIASACGPPNGRRVNLAMTPGTGAGGTNTWIPACAGMTAYSAACFGLA